MGEEKRALGSVLARSLPRMKEELTISRKGPIVNKSQEQRLNLSRSQQQGYSTAYNTQFQIQVVCKGSVFPKLRNSSNGRPRALARVNSPTAYDSRLKVYLYASQPGEGKHRRF